MQKNEDCIMKRYERELTLEELAAMPDSEIDYSDIPELDEEFFKHARLVIPEEEGKERITIRLSKRVLDFFRNQGKGYQTRIDAVLRVYVDRQENLRQTKDSKI